MGTEMENLAARHRAANLRGIGAAQALRGMGKAFKSFPVPVSILRLVVSQAEAAADMLSVAAAAAAPVVAAVAKAIGALPGGAVPFEEAVKALSNAGPARKRPADHLRVVPPPPNGG